MSYAITKTLESDFQTASEKTRQALAAEGFGILNEIDFQATLKKKLDQEIPPYLILGACHPQSAYDSYQAEAKIGVMLPCNVIVRALDNGKVEVSAIDPAAMMEPIANPDLNTIATSVGERLRKVIDQL